MKAEADKAALDKTIADAAAAEAAEAAAADAPWGFVVSKIPKGRHHCLHHMGSCWRVPGRHYPDFEVWGDLMPPEKSLHSKCKDCFPPVAVLAAKEPEPEEVDDCSSSSSSSGSPPAKKPKEGEGGSE